MNQSLHFMLKVRQFIEMVSGQDSAFDEENNITATIRFVNLEMLPLFSHVVIKPTVALLCVRGNVERLNIEPTYVRIVGPIKAAPDNLVWFGLFIVTLSTSTSFYVQS